MLQSSDDLQLDSVGGRPFRALQKVETWRKIKLVRCWPQGGVDGVHQLALKTIHPDGGILGLSIP